MTNIISGKEVASEIERSVSDRVGKHVSAGKRAPCLSVVLVGDDPASQVYVGHKEKACARVGIESRVIRLEAATSKEEVVSTIQKLNADEGVDGILVQLPLPDGLDGAEIVQLIAPEKDVDGLTYVNQGKLAVGVKGLFPCTPLGCIELIKKTGLDIKGKNAVVVGRSILVGSPAAKMLVHEGATVTTVHSKTSDPKSVCKNADILVVAAGKKRLVKGDWVKKGAVVIDVGIHRHEGKLTGDVDFSSVSELASAITPVPGGVGPMTIAMLLSNCLTAYEERES